MHATLYYNDTWSLRHGEPKVCTCICLSHISSSHWPGEETSPLVLVAAYEAATNDQMAGGADTDG
jgi:hypothetical protein